MNLLIDLGFKIFLTINNLCLITVLVLNFALSYITDSVFIYSLYVLNIFTLALLLLSILFNHKSAILISFINIIISVSLIILLGYFWINISVWSLISSIICFIYLILKR